MADSSVSQLRSPNFENSVTHVNCHSAGTCSASALRPLSASRLSFWCLRATAKHIISSDHGRITAVISDSESFLFKTRRAEWRENSIITQPQWSRDSHVIGSGTPFQICFQFEKEQLDEFRFLLVFLFPGDGKPLGMECILAFFSIYRTT